MKPTIKDVAQKSGVSVATVSRILNGLGGYSEQTKQKVLAVIAETGYKPNAVARGLISKRTNTIGVLVPNVSSMLATMLLSGIEEAAHDNNYSVIMCNSDHQGKRTLDYLKVLSEKQVDGIIFCSEWLKDEYHEAIEAMRVPVVLVSTMSRKYQLPYVKADDFAAAYAATAFLINKGHREIGMISGSKSDLIAGLPRLQGYMQALQDHGIIFKESHVAYGDFGFKSGVEAMSGLRKRCPGLTAVFAASDEMALGAISFAFSQGIPVPEDLSVIGYDNTEIAEMSIPPLTTVQQPIYEMGRRASKLILEMIETGEPAESIIMPHKVVERQSVKKMGV